MSDKNLARRTKVEINFDGINITDDISPYFLSLSHTDNEEDETDDLQIKLQDRDDIWLEKWLNQAIDAAATEATYTTGSSSSIELSAGTVLTLNSVKGYSSSTTSSSFGTKTGTFYAWDNKVLRGRIRITNRAEHVGVAGQVTCWISFDDATAAANNESVQSTTTVSGLTIQAIIHRLNWHGDGKDDFLDCGSFELDSVEASGPPSVIIIKATSLPFSTQIRQTKKTRSWESYYLSGIAEEMASKNGLSCMYLCSTDPRYQRLEQFNMSDISFLSNLCHDQGFSLKVTKKTLVLFDQMNYESAKPVFTFAKGDGSYLKYKLQASTADTQYTSCRVSYTLPNGESIEGIARVDDYDAKDEKNQQLEIRAKVSSIGEAEHLAAKQLRLHNKFGKKASFTTTLNPFLISGLTIKIENWGAFSGKYIITQAKHTVGSSGSSTQIQARKVLEGY